MENVPEKPLGSRVAERTAALLREYGGDRAKEATASSSGGGGQPDPKSQLAALKTVLGKPHVYGVADRAFQ